MRYFIKIIDMFAATVVGGFLFAHLGIGMILGGRIKPHGKKLLVLDMAYTLEMVQKRQLQESITSRDLDGFFDYVWSVHPCATVIPPENPQEFCGPVVESRLAERHTVAEGKLGRYNFLKPLPLFNFLLAQWNVYHYLVGLIKKEKICIIRAGDPYYLGLWAVLLSRTCRIPCAVRVNVNYDAFYASTGNLAFPRLFRKRWIEKKIDRFILKRMDLVAGANQDNLNFALANGARPEKTTVFRYGNLIHSAHFREVDERPSAEENLKELGLWQKEFSMTISRLEKLKQVDDVIRIIAEINKRGYPLYGLLVGEGRMKDRLTALAQDLDLGDRIIFAGNRNQEWLAGMIPRAKVIISPFMGRALTEAALGGAPIVAYDIDWQSELIQTGKTGELIPYKDWRAMGDAVEKYLRDPEYARKMGDNVQKVVKEMMDPVKLREHEKITYEGVLQRYFGADYHDRALMNSVKA